MGADSKIEWTHHTFNPWWGCVKVSPGCTNCYAEAFDRRVNGTVRHVDSTGNDREPHWGKDAPRRFFGDAHWREPLKWSRDAQKAGERRRVFCASMADVFEDRADLHEQRDRLFALIHATKHLDWLLLTKRPERVMEVVPESWCDGLPRNVWMGTTVEDQQRADERIPHLLGVPAAVRFLSVEPLLGPVDLRRWLLPMHPDDQPSLIEWVIVGGESGPGARPCNVAWIRSVVRQCREAGVPCFVKQMGRGYSLHTNLGRGFHHEDNATGMRFICRDHKGGDPAEWPLDLRVRESPEVRT